VTSTSTRRPLTAVGLLATAAGVALFVWIVRAVGSREVLDGFRQIGWGLAIVVILGGLRFATRAMAWMLCFEPPYGLSFRDAFGAVVAGDALGNITPLGPIVGEPTKAAFVRSRVALGPTLTALAIENVLYTLSVAAMIAVGMMALLFRFKLPGELREISEVAIAGVALIFATSLWLVWKQPAILSRAAALLPGSSARLERIRALEQQVYTFASRRGTAMVPLLGCELAFHVLGVLEAHVTLWMMQGFPPALLTSFLVETVNRLITVAFKFVPMQVGVNEAGSALLTQVLGLGAAPGATLAVVRKVRTLCWIAVGMVLFFKRGLSARSVLAG
jgi:Lysylphosphatidylglycerol synthase TM region